MGLPLDYAVIFDRGGRVHWSRALGKVRGDPVSALISNVLLEEKGGVDQSATIDSYACHWRPVNEADALIVVVSQKSLALDFVPELLESMKAAFSAQFKGVFLASAYDATFTSIEAALDGKLRLRAKAAMRAAPVEKAKAAAPKAAPAAVADDDDGPAESVEESVEDKLKKRGALAKGRKVPGKASSAPLPKAAAEAGKKKTVWADSTKKLSAKEAACLDRSADKDVDPDEARSAAEMKARMPERGEAAAWDVEDELAIDDDEDDDYVVETIEDASSKKSWFAKGVGLMGSITGETILTAEQIAPIMDTLRQRLEEKNVAVEIAADICASVTSSIVGKKVARFGRAKTLIRDALKDAVARVLTPRKSTDVLREVLAAKGRRKGPYSIVFVGINGVGKSTTLSKVAYYLKEHGVDVQITACDTFRSGAVEQLRSHARCLDVELYEKGYLKDPSDVAKSSLDHAKAQKRDCVLIDTAGRMQNNDKLMRELAKLVTVNDPDLILFVGEALVGNDGIDQLNMFNSALQSFCGNGRCIDGLVLTKFDTIDDKVGATLSMTYKTGQPIMFIGVGQKYTHLKKLSVETRTHAERRKDLLDLMRGFDPCCYEAYGGTLENVHAAQPSNGAAEKKAKAAAQPQLQRAPTPAKAPPPQKAPSSAPAAKAPSSAPAAKAPSSEPAKVAVKPAAKAATQAAKAPPAHKPVRPPAHKPVRPPARAAPSKPPARKTKAPTKATKATKPPPKKFVPDSDSEYDD